MVTNFPYTENPVFNGQSMRGHLPIRGQDSQNNIKLCFHVKEPAMKGQPPCRDTFSAILRCPLRFHCMLQTTKD